MTNKTGLKFDSFEFQIEKGKIREFAQAIGDPNPIYFSEDEAQKAGFQAIPIPPTFPTVIDMWGGLDFEKLIQVLELNPLQVLHGEQAYEYVATVYANDRLTAFPQVMRHITKAGMDFITIETTYKRKEETVLISRSTVIERHGGDQS